MRQINRHPQHGMRIMLMLLPFVLLIAAWFVGSTLRLEANPNCCRGCRRCCRPSTGWPSRRIVAAVSIYCGPIRSLA